ncbi:HlyC/CorC family transporter [Alloscardovia theropitheci]|uniref:HlyC/CorC family transporter n=1 Tax=Alloscardovia theropitheci TaxID=2496842 RepID=A0A4R0R1Q1_9BIFI|nr:hemolysin family protein [Alloscardovia theropitheci]TCD55086.1 HlyC/CorC family transporter [Alloscardovia theropitheci]
MNTASLIVAICLYVVSAGLLWFSLIMAANESAIARVTRSNLNNLMLDVRTNEDSEFLRRKTIARIRHAQNVILQRQRAVMTCTFSRVMSNILIGALVAIATGVFGVAIWAEVLIGIVVAVISATIAVLISPRSSNQRSVNVLLQYAPFIDRAMHIMPRVDIERTQQVTLSDDEELEKIHHDQARATIDRLIEAHLFDPEISEMLRNVLILTDTLTREIMVPRTDMFSLERTTTLNDMLKDCSRSGFSRVPVTGESVDDLVGIAYLKDVVRATAFNPAAGERAIETIMREPMLVPESKPVDDLFHDMQTKRQHVAIVVDEYGGIAGLVTIEDALEQIVGEMEDEHDRVQRHEPERMEDGGWKVPARTSITDIEELFEIDLDEDDVDTAYGLLTKALGRVPIVGSHAQTRGLDLIAVDSAGRRKKVSTIEIRRSADTIKSENKESYDSSSQES